MDTDEIPFTWNFQTLRNWKLRISCCTLLQTVITALSAQTNNSSGSEEVFCKWNYGICFLGEDGYPTSGWHAQECLRPGPSYDQQFKTLVYSAPFSVTKTELQLTEVLYVMQVQAFTLTKKLEIFWQRN